MIVFLNKCWSTRSYIPYLKGRSIFAIVRMDIADGPANSYLSGLRGYHTASKMLFGCWRSFSGVWFLQLCSNNSVRVHLGCFRVSSCSLTSHISAPRQQFKSERKRHLNVKKVKRNYCTGLNEWHCSLESPLDLGVCHMFAP